MNIPQAQNCTTNRQHSKVRQTSRTRRLRAGSLLAALALVGAPVISTVGLSRAAAATCTGTLDSSTLTLPMVASAVGASSLWSQGFKGRGIDVAVIDTGVNAVPGLALAGKVVDAVDLSLTRRIPASAIATFTATAPTWPE